MSGEEQLTGPGAWLARLLKVPPKPDPPLGSPGSLKVFRAAPGYVRYRMVGWAISHAMSFFFLGLGPVVVALAVMLADDVDALVGVAALVGAALCLGAWLAFALLGWLTIRVDRDLRWYMVTDRTLRIREGVWFVREMTLTFANIQNVSVSQGPLQRAFGISDLVVQTAGGGGGGEAQAGHAAGMHIGRFRGLDDANGVKDFVLARMKAATGTGVDDAPEEGGRLDALRDVAAEAQRLRAAVDARRQA